MHAVCMHRMFKFSYNTDQLASERQELRSRENVDIGHITYIDVCQELDTVPIRLVIEQLKGTEVCLQHIGLNTRDVIAIMYALLVCLLLCVCVSLSLRLLDLDKKTFLTLYKYIDFYNPLLRTAFKLL